MKDIYVDELVSIWVRHRITVSDDYTEEQLKIDLEENGSSPELLEGYEDMEVLTDTLDQYDVNYSHTFESSFDGGKTFKICY